jgi:hypothetical protein
LIGQASRKKVNADWAGYADHIDAEMRIAANPNEKPSHRSFDCRGFISSRSLGDAANRTRSIRQIRMIRQIHVQRSSLLARGRAPVAEMS